MHDDQHQKAIDLALAGQWKEAVTANLAALRGDAKNVDTLNRLARAYLETGFKTKALEIYKKVLRIDKFNNIATKNIEFLKNYKIERGSTKHVHLQASNTMFLEEPGLTKTVTLIRPGDPKTLSHVRAGDEIAIAAREHSVCATNLTGQYLGRFSDDLASRLGNFIKGGNKYQAWVRSIDNLTLKIFIKETFRSPKFASVPSFPLTEKLSYAAFTPPELVHEEKPDVSATEFQEEDDKPDNSNSGRETVTTTEE